MQFRATLLLLALGAATAVRNVHLRASSANVKQNLTANGKQKGVYYDGFSRAGCEVDISPKEQRMYFKEHACVGMPPGSSCRLQTLGMTPTLCFDFCRQHEAMKFFGIEYGRDCYCTGYFHPKSTGGQGTCNLPCEGDNKEMCGGPDKSSLFEMHWCDASAGRVEMAFGMAKEASGKAGESADAGKSLFDKTKELQEAWELGVCSVEPEGPRVCSYPKAWLEAGSAANAAANDASHAADVVGKEVDNLDSASSAVEEAGDEVTGEQAGAQDTAVDAVKDASIAATTAAAKVNNTIAQWAGPLTGSPLDNFEGMFQVMGNAEKKWHAVCALEQIPGQTYVAEVEQDTAAAVCAKKCFDLVTGTQSCVAFNIQYMNGLAACQLLQEEGLTKPAISKAVPIFEVSESKRDAMKLETLDCYAKQSFIGSHPAGPLKTDVIRSVTVDR